MIRLLAIVILAGCNAKTDTSSTLGQRGRARFSYLASPGCEDGCNLDEFWVASDGAKQKIRVKGASFASVESAAPSVASFAMSGADVEATTAAAGDVDLVLRDSAGAEVDRVSVHVGEARRLQIDPNWPETGPVILDGVPLTGFSVKKIDAGERVLLGSDAVRFSTTGTVTSLGRTPQAGAGATSIIESIRLQGTPGRGTIEGVNANARLSIPVTVVRVDDLNRIGAAVTFTRLGVGGVLESLAEVFASSPEGMAYGIGCAWTVTDPSVQIQDDVKPENLDHKPIETLTFRLTKSGMFTATCKIGRLDVTVNLGN